MCSLIAQWASLNHHQSQLITCTNASPATRPPLGVMFVSCAVMVDCQRSIAVSMKTSETLPGDGQTFAPSADIRRKSSRHFLPIAWALSVLAGAAFAVLLPRPTYPQILPLPIVSGSDQHAREAIEIDRASKVRNGSLSWEARAIGEQLRRIGKATANGSAPDSKQLAQLRGDVESALRQEGGEKELLHLRALQAELFLAAVSDFERTGEPSSALLELGGPFLGLAKGSWISSEGKILLEKEELRLSFRIYWSKMTGLLEARVFSPTLDEYRRYYRTNLLKPPAPSSDSMSQLLAQLAMARALGRVDPSYPGRLAEGMLQIRLGQFKEAERSLQAFVETHPTGPWTQIAKNHFLLAIREAQSLEL